MSEVSAWACQPYINAVCGTGQSPGVLVEGLTTTLETLEKRSARIPWNDFTIILERTAEILGGAEKFEDVMSKEFEFYDLWGSSGLFVLFGRVLRSSRPLYTLGASWIGPTAFLNTRGRCEDLPDGRIKQIVEIMPPFSHCDLFFRGISGILRGVPTLIGFGEANVEMVVEPCRGTFTITPPRRTFSAFSFARRRKPSRKVVADAVADLSDSHSELQKSLFEARQQGWALRAQSRRLETLNQLSQELMQHTDVEDLSDYIVKLLMKHFRFEGVRLSVAPRTGSALEVKKQAGELRGEPVARHILRTATGCVGRIDLWGIAIEESAGADHLLADLLPWIALVFDNARSFEALNRQTERLQEEIGERRRAEKQLEQAMRLEAVGRIAGGLAHDFNNVLSAIMAHAELAGDGIPKGGPGREDLDQICAVSERASGLIAQVLAFAREQVLHPVRIDLDRMVLELEAMLRRVAGKNVELVVVPGENTGVVVADGARLEQVIVNLVANSRDAMPDGGQIVIETANVYVGSDDQHHSPKLKPGRFVRLEVRDTGCGMDSDTRDHMFEPFFTTKNAGEGTGLGLSTSYGTVAQLGGAIEVASEPGKGAAIAILLPWMGDQLEQSDTSQSTDLPA